MTDNGTSEHAAEGTGDRERTAVGPQGWEPYGPPRPAGWEPYGPPAPQGWEPYGPPRPAGWEPYAPPARGPQGWEPYGPPRPAGWEPYGPPRPAGWEPYGPPVPQGWEPYGPPRPAGWEPYGPPAAGGVSPAGQRDREEWASGFITSIAASSESPGVWVYLTGAGWKRLSQGHAEPDATDAPAAEQNGHVAAQDGGDGSAHLTQLALLAKNYRLPVSYHEDAYGQLDRLIV